MVLTTETFIKKAKEIHGNKYDYSKVVYTGCRNKVCIICPEHGEFWQVPYYHLAGNGCPECFNEKRRGKTKQLTTEEFIRRAREIHGDKYDYSKTVYKLSQEKVCIICPLHGEFWIKPNKHLSSKRGCPKCGREKMGRERRLTTEEFINKARLVHGNRYDYSKVVYESSKKEVCIICPEHGEFWQKAENHLGGCGCHECNKWELEENIKKLLYESGFRFEIHKTFPWLKYKTNLHLDFFLPDNDLAIECQGSQHFKSVKYFGGDEDFIKRVERDKIKKRLCKENGVKILYYTKSKEGKMRPDHFSSELEIINEIKKIVS